MIREAVDNIHDHVVYPYLVSGDAKRNREIAHDRTLRLLATLEGRPSLRAAIGNFLTYRDPRLHTDLAGLELESPIGMAAGFDKDGIVPNALCALGNAYSLVGTVPPRPQMGAAQPRVFALPKDGAMINRMSFPSEGMDFIYKKLEQNPPDPGKIRGISAGPNALSVKNGRAFDDYIAVVKRLVQFGHFIELNPSSPNTSGLRESLNCNELADLTSEVKKVINQHIATTQCPSKPAKKIPLGIKLSPDQSKKEIIQSLDAMQGNIDFVVVANTSINASLRAQLTDEYRKEEGGFSGRPLTHIVLEMSHFIFEETGGKLPIVRSGGVMTADDYWDALTYGGASLVQLYTAFVDKKTSTPNLAYYMNRSVVERMQRLRTTDLQNVRGIKENMQHAFVVR